VTVRDVWQWFLDLQIWQAILLLLACSFAGGFFGSMGHDLGRRISKARLSAADATRRLKPDAEQSDE
jgi:hypothetical protein